MNQLYFTKPYRRSLKTLRLEFGEIKNKFLLKSIEGEINGKGTSEFSPREEVFDNDQVMLKESNFLKRITSSHLLVKPTHKIKSDFINPPLSGNDRCRTKLHNKTGWKMILVPVEDFILIIKHTKQSPSMYVNQSTHENYKNP